MFFFKILHCTFSNFYLLVLFIGTSNVDVFMCLSVIIKLKSNKIKIK